MDVVARSKGAPATGLTKNDFTLLDNGKPQAISFFSVHSANTTAVVAPLPPGTISNRFARDGATSANTTVLLIDQKSTPQALQAFAIPRVAKFVESRHKRDVIGIYTLLPDGSLHVVQELTDDPELLAQAAKTLRSRNPDRQTSDTGGMTQHAAAAYKSMSLSDTVQATRHALEEIARHLSNLPGRKSLVWITTAFPLFIPGGLDFRPDMEKAARALNDANVALYAVDARGLIGSLGAMTGIGAAESKGPRPRTGGVRMPSPNSLGALLPAPRRW